MRFEKFTALLTAGVAELGIRLNPTQIQQFFFTFRNSKSGMLKSI
jgi:hypothetical protein